MWWHNLLILRISCLLWCLSYLLSVINANIPGQVKTAGRHQCEETWKWNQWHHLSDVLDRKCRLSPSYVINSTSIHRLHSEQKDRTNAVKPRVQTHTQPFQLFFFSLQGLTLFLNTSEPSEMNVVAFYLFTCQMSFLVIQE